MDKPLDVAGLAALLGISPSWIYKKCAARALPHTRPAGQIRFTEDHIREILAAFEEPVLAAPTALPVVRIRPQRRRAA